MLDPRIHAYRSDIADIALAGQLFAPHYARPMIRRVAQNAALRAEPDAASADAAALAAGDEFAVLDISGGWAWGYKRAGHLVGYVEASLLAD